jgi:hypothetical protein
MEGVFFLYYMRVNGKKEKEEKNTIRKSTRDYFFEKEDIFFFFPFSYNEKKKNVWLEKIIFYF